MQPNVPILGRVLLIRVPTYGIGAENTHRYAAITVKLLEDGSLLSQVASIIMLEQHRERMTSGRQTESAHLDGDAFHEQRSSTQNR